MHTSTHPCKGRCKQVSDPPHPKFRPDPSRTTSPTLQTMYFAIEKVPRTSMGKSRTGMRVGAPDSRRGIRPLHACGYPRVMCMYMVGARGGWLVELCAGLGTGRGGELGTGVGRWERKKEDIERVRRYRRSEICAVREVASMCSSCPPISRSTHTVEIAAKHVSHMRGVHVAGVPGLETLVLIGCFRWVNFLLERMSWGALA